MFFRCFLSTKRGVAFDLHTTFISHKYFLWYILFFSKCCWIILFLLNSFLLWFYLSDWFQLIKRIFSLPLLSMYVIHIKDSIWFNLLLSHRYLYISMILCFHSYGEREGIYLSIPDLCGYIRMPGNACLCKNWTAL